MKEVLNVQMHTGNLLKMSVSLQQPRRQLQQRYLKLTIAHAMILHLMLAAIQQLPIRMAVWDVASVVIKHVESAVLESIQARVEHFETQSLNLLKKNNDKLQQTQNANETNRDEKELPINLAQLQIKFTSYNFYVSEEFSIFYNILDLGDI